MSVVQEVEQAGGVAAGQRRSPLVAEGRCEVFLARADYLVDFVEEDQRPTTRAIEPPKKLSLTSLLAFDSCSLKVSNGVGPPSGCG